MRSAPTWRAEMRRLLTLIVALAAAACPAPAPAVAAAPPAVIVDTDMDFDDVAALAYLAEADRLGMIDLRAVTVAGDGVAFPGAGLGHARCLLTKLGMGHLPTSDGIDTRNNNFPPVFLDLLDAVVDRAVRPAPDVPCVRPARRGACAGADRRDAPRRRATGDGHHARAAHQPGTGARAGPGHRCRHRARDTSWAATRRAGLPATPPNPATTTCGSTRRPPKRSSAPSGRVWMTGRSATDQSRCQRRSGCGSPRTGRPPPPRRLHDRVGPADPDRRARPRVLVGPADRRRRDRRRRRALRAHPDPRAADRRRRRPDLRRPGRQRVHFSVSADPDRFHDTFLEVLNHCPAR